MTVMEVMIRKVTTTMTNLIILSLLNRILKEKPENRYFCTCCSLFLLNGTCNRTCIYDTVRMDVRYHSYCILCITRDRYKSPLTLCSFSNYKGRLVGIDGSSLTRVSWKVKTRKSAIVEIMLVVKMNKLSTLMLKLYCQKVIQRLFPHKTMMRLAGVLPKKRRWP